MIKRDNPDQKKPSGVLSAKRHSRSASFKQAEKKAKGDFQEQT